MLRLSWLRYMRMCSVHSQEDAIACAYHSRQVSETEHRRVSPSPFTRPSGRREHREVRCRDQRRPVDPAKPWGFLQVRARGGGSQGDDRADLGYQGGGRHRLRPRQRGSQSAQRGHSSGKGSMFFACVRTTACTQSAVPKCFVRAAGYRTRQCCNAHDRVGCFYRARTESIPPQLRCSSTRSSASQRLSPSRARCRWYDGSKIKATTYRSAGSALAPAVSP